jgi:peptide deformylase
MSILKVARMGHPTLREKARRVEGDEFKDPAFQTLVDDMIETMHEYAGVGLAGPQVHERRRVFVAVLNDDEAPLR